MVGKQTTRFWGSISLLLFGISQSVIADDADTLKVLQEQIQQQQQQLEQQQHQIEALAEQLEKKPADSSKVSKKTGGLSWEGYGVVNYQRFDFFENAQDTEPETRASTDLERIILAPHFDMGNGYHFVAEIEFEHGGTGATVEFEPEEAGEFEIEIEKGGEVILEQAQLIIEHSPALNFRFGEFLVPFGMINTHHEPTQYFTLQRSLAENSLLPSVWHEAGIGLFGEIGQLRYEGQIITALDSSGFSGFNFIKGGMQSKLEIDNADDLAFVGNINYSPLLGVTLGGAFYTGDSSGNRPRKNLNESANVTLFEIHGRLEKGPLAIRAEYLEGTIENSDAVTQANLTTFNGGVLGVSKTPVGHKAEAWFIEAGYDIFSLFNKDLGKLFGFARYEAYDTHAETEGVIAKVARYDREATTFGVNYHPRPGVVFKAEYSYRENASSQANEQDVYGLGVGFEF